MNDPRQFGSVPRGGGLDPFDLNWKDGPLPPDTWHWGGVVLKEMDGPGKDYGFHFADFRGDHVVINPYTEYARTVKPEEVLKYNNTLHLPPAY